LNESNEKLHLKKRFLARLHKHFKTIIMKKSFFPLAKIISFLSWFVHCLASAIKIVETLFGINGKVNILLKKKDLKSLIQNLKLALPPYLCDKKFLTNGAAKEFNDDLVGNIYRFNRRSYFCYLQSLGMAYTYFTFCCYIIR
jgi:hypothetical protein